MRNTVLIVAALAATAFVLRRSRRFGPVGTLAAAAILERVVETMRNKDEPPPAAKPSLWTRLTASKNPPPPAPAAPPVET